MAMTFMTLKTAPQYPEMRNEFRDTVIDKPVEFEITDYDKAKKNSKYPQKKEESVITDPAPEAPTQTPEIKKEPPEETNNQEQGSPENLKI